MFENGEVLQLKALYNTSNTKERPVSVIARTSSLNHSKDVQSQS